MSDVDVFSLRVDEDEFTIGDLEDFEKAAGVPFLTAVRATPDKDEDGNTLFDDDGRPVKSVKLSFSALKALVWVVKRREIPGFSVEDARNVKVTTIEFVDAEDVPADPKE